MFKALFCNHDYEGRGFSYAVCKKCNKQIYSPEIAQKKINNFCSDMVESGYWKKEEVDLEKMKRRI